MIGADDLLEQAVAETDAGQAFGGAGFDAFVIIKERAAVSVEPDYLHFGVKSCVDIFEIFGRSTLGGATRWNQAPAR